MKGQVIERRREEKREEERGGGGRRSTEDQGECRYTQKPCVINFLF